MSMQPDTPPSDTPASTVDAGGSGDGHDEDRPAEAAHAVGGLPTAVASRTIDLTGATIRNLAPPSPTNGAATIATQLADDTEAGEFDTRQRIVEAAAAVFREKGFTGTRVVDIARRAGYTSGALYGYFDSRAELLAEAIASASSQMLERLLGTFGGDEVPDQMAVLEAALSQLTVPLDESDQMLLDGVALAHREPVAGERLAEALGRFRSQLQGSATDGSETPRITDGGADLLVILVLGITAARALGLHDAPPDDIREHLAGCLASRPD